MKLMQPFSLAFLAAAVLTLAFAPTNVESLVADEAFADAPVTVSVTCVSDSTLDWSKLSLAELALAGNALASSYNSVHEPVDNDDSKLNNLSFHGVSQRRMLEVGENVEWKRRLSKGVWTGDWACTLCPDDDDPDLSGPEHIAWQNEFVATLLESSHAIFQTIRSCSIDLEPSDDLGSVAPPNADIDLWCGKHIDLSKLSVPKGTFLAHALQVSYNKAHADMSDDDSVLTNVFYHQSLPKKNKFILAEDVNKEENVVKKSAPWYNPKYNNKWNYGGYNSGVTAPGLSGDWSCRLCIQDDDLLFEGQDGTSKSSLAAKKHRNQQLQTAASGDALKAWEAELNVLLKESPFESFRNLDVCQIKLLPHTNGLEETSTERGCGIRGSCNDVSARVE